MELLQITLAANETKQFAKAGRYFEIIDSAGPITVNFTGENGAMSDSMVNAFSGLFLEDAYSHFAVTNGTSAQAITLLLMETGRGGSRRQPGVVRVVNEITDAIQVYGNTNSGIITTWGVVPILLPAANLKGLILRAAGVAAASSIAGAANTVSARIVAAKSAPTSPTVPTQQWPAAVIFTENSTLTATKEDDQMNKSIPPGWGLYHCFSIAGVGASQNYAYAAYELQ